ncbi:MAG TPA: hypothetical protein VMD06_02705 [Steroidobacteraceae bacterium]|nr:hypothetical protein [Steroidobacteraceae bacterium]
MIKAHHDYSSPRLTMDFGSSYAITHSIEVYFDASFDARNRRLAPRKARPTDHDSTYNQRRRYPWIKA